jgi:DNA-binding winged helix-turn-helix (wHTH) protein
MNGEERHLYHFKSFRLDVKERQLLHHGNSIPITPKAFDVLAALVERNGHLVEKEELLRIVWSDSFVEEANVARIVHTLRKVLGEDDNGNKFIETVAKKGYRFVAEVEKVCETARDSENDYHPYFWLWVVSDVQGNEAEAYEWFIKYQTQIKADPETIRLYQTAYQKSGGKGILREVIKQDEKTIKLDNNPDLLYEAACFHAKLGDKDKAFENLDKAYERRRSSLNFIKVDPSLDSLHDDPRFEQLVKRSGLN